MNWREAILQAQQKIDQVLDIKSDKEDDDIYEKNENIMLSQLSTDGRNKIMFEFPQNPEVIPDELNSFGAIINVSPEIEEITRFSTDGLSPNPETSAVFEDEILAREKKLDRNFEDLETELHEYRKAIKVSHAHCLNLERKMEEEAFAFNQKMMDSIREEKLDCERQNLHLKSKCSELSIENRKLEEKLSTSSILLSDTRHCLRDCKTQLQLISECLNGPKNLMRWDFEKLNYDIERNLIFITTSASSIKKGKLFSYKDSTVDSRVVSTQTDDQEYEPARQHFFVENASKAKAFQISNNNSEELLRIIERLEAERNELFLDLSRKNAEIEKLKARLSESLVMQGEKIELIEEMRVDNEDLRMILKQQALEFSFQ